MYLVRLKVISSITISHWSELKGDNKLKASGLLWNSSSSFVLGGRYFLSVHISM